MPTEAIVIQLNGDHENAQQLQAVLAKTQPTRLLENLQDALRALRGNIPSQSLVLIVGRPETGELSEIAFITAGRQLRVALVGTCLRDEKSAEAAKLGYIALSTVLPN